MNGPALHVMEALPLGVPCTHTSGLTPRAWLRCAQRSSTSLRGFVPTAYAVPALAAPAVPASVPAVPATALADGASPRASRQTGASRRGRTSASTATARRPAADSDSARMMDLVERAQAGEAEAFGRLYDQYSDTVYRYIYYRVGGKATAEDLTSETFLRALRRIGTFTWQGRDFGAWLVTIARNLVADHFKSSRFRLEVTTGEMLDANEVERSPEDSVLESLSNAALLDAVRTPQPPAAGVRHPPLPPGPLGRRDRPRDGQERGRDQDPPVPRRPHPGPAPPGRRPLRPRDRTLDRTPTSRRHLRDAQLTLRDVR